jgi:hypothetical protein
MALDVRLIFTTASRILGHGAKLIDSFFADPGIFIGLKLPVARFLHSGRARRRTNQLQ